ncbi:hypothetical protein SBADM41S_07800 [Streptomyces badius]
MCPYSIVAGVLSPFSCARRWMRDQSSQWVRWSTMCWRTSQSKISAPPPVSDSRPASISSSRISEAESPEIVSKWWISVAVNAFSATFGRASFSALSERG